MTSSKKIKKAEEETIKSYDLFLLDIDKYFVNRIHEYDKIHEKKLERVEDKLYFLSIKKNISLENCLKNKNQWKESYNLKLKSLKILLEDLKINEDEYNKKLSSIKEKYNDGNFFEEKYKKDIEKINLDFKNKKTKLNDMHKRKKELYSKYRKKYESKELKLKNKSIRNLNNKRKLVLDANEKFKNNIDNSTNLLIKKHENKISSFKN